MSNPRTNANNSIPTAEVAVVPRLNRSSFGNMDVICLPAGQAGFRRLACPAQVDLIGLLELFMRGVLFSAKKDKKKKDKKTQPR